MFKNIFSDNLNRFVYKNPGKPDVRQYYVGTPEQRKAAEAKLAAGKEVQKGLKASPEELKNENKRLGKAIDDFINQVQENQNIKRGIAGQKAIKIDLNNHKSYENLPRTLRDVVQSLAEANKQLGGNPGRTGLELVRVEINAASEFYKAYKKMAKKGDPLEAFPAEMKKVARAKPGKEGLAPSKETKEAASWVKIARIVEELRNPNKVPSKAREATLRGDLSKLVTTTMKGKNAGEQFKSGYLTITRSPNRLKRVYEISVNMRHFLEQQGLPGHRAARYKETVYIGGTVNDFESSKKRS